MLEAVWIYWGRLPQGVGSEAHAGKYLKSSIVCSGTGSGNTDRDKTYRIGNECESQILYRNRPGRLWEPPKSVRKEGKGDL